MAIVLQVFGVVFLLLVVALVVGVLRIRAKVRGFVRTLEGLSRSMTPVRIELLPLAAPGWADAGAVELLTEPLASLGFLKAGNFRAGEAGGLEIEGWVNPEKAVTAVVYEHPQVGVWLDFYTHFQDGTRITFTNTPREEGVSHPPGYQVERFPGLVARDLHERFLAARPDKAAREVSVESFAPVFEQACAEEQEWKDRADGGMEAQIRAVAALSGKAYDENFMTATRGIAERQAVAELEESLRNRFLDETRMTASEWEKVRDRVVLIHDRMGSENFEELISPWMSGEQVNSVDHDPEESLRRVFAGLNESLPPGRRFTKLGSVSGPAEADVYVLPED